MPTFGETRATEPNPTPPVLHSCIPNFAHCGEDNCGEHSPSFLTPSYATRRRCISCSRLVRIQNLHPLPCGHDLCRDCLDIAVGKIDQCISSRDRWDTSVEPLLETRNDCLIRAGQAIEQSLPSLAARYTEEADRALLQAQRALKMTCCGMDMHLEKHLYCMALKCARQWVSADWGVRLPSDARDDAAGRIVTDGFPTGASSAGRMSMTYPSGTACGLQGTR